MSVPWLTPTSMTQVMRLLDSHQRLVGRELLPQGTHPAETAAALYQAPFVVVSHGTEPDPILNYGNAAALALWAMDWHRFTTTPSRLTAEAPEREERARLLAAVSANGYIDDYSGIRISSSGRRFRIARATVWNLVDSAGQPCGQAATFSDWIWIDNPTGSDSGWTSRVLPA